LANGRLGEPTLPKANPQSLYRLDQQDSGTGLLAQRDRVALHEFGTGTDFIAAVRFAFGPPTSALIGKVRPSASVAAQVSGIVSRGSAA